MHVRKQGQETSLADAGHAMPKCRLLHASTLHVREAALQE